jgi:hypothetical protein
VEETGLPHHFQPEARNYRDLADAIFKKCGKKNSQCSSANLPTLLAVGTFHVHASYLCMGRRCANTLLTGEPYISWNINTQTGNGIGDAFQTTTLYSASFLQSRAGSIQVARASLSGLLLCGFGSEPPKVLGVLHPLADRPFDRRLLPNIQFGEVQINHTTGQLCTSWPTEAETDGEPADLEDFLP